MAIKFDIQIDGIPVIARRVKSAAYAAAHAVAVAAEEDTRPFVPMGETGRLTNSSKVDGNFIEYRAPGVGMLYRGKVMVDPETGSAYARSGARKVATSEPLEYDRSGHPLATDHWFEASKAVNMRQWEAVGKEAEKRELAKKK